MAPPGFVPLMEWIGRDCRDEKEAAAAWALAVVAYIQIAMVAALAIAGLICWAVVGAPWT